MSQLSHDAFDAAAASFSVASICMLFLRQHGRVTFSVGSHHENEALRLAVASRAGLQDFNARDSLLDLLRDEELKLRKCDSLLVNFH